MATQQDVDDLGLAHLYPGSGASGVGPLGGSDDSVQCPGLVHLAKVSLSAAETAQKGPEALARARDNRRLDFLTPFLTSFFGCRCGRRSRPRGGSRTCCTGSGGLMDLSLSHTTTTLHLSVMMLPFSNQLLLDWTLPWASRKGELTVLTVSSLWMCDSLMHSMTHPAPCSSPSTNTPSCCHPSTTQRIL